MSLNFQGLLFYTNIRKPQLPVVCLLVGKISVLPRKQTNQTFRLNSTV